MPAKKRNGRGGARMGAGRKPKPASERQDHHVTLNLTSKEHDMLSEAAGEQSLASYVRQLVLRHLARRRK